MLSLTATSLLQPLLCRGTRTLTSERVKRIKALQSIVSDKRYRMASAAKPAIHGVVFDMDGCAPVMASCADVDGLEH
jgi:hypothetical protein